MKTILTLVTITLTLCGCFGEKEVDRYTSDFGKAHMEINLSKLSNEFLDKNFNFEFEKVVVEFSAPDQASIYDVIHLSKANTQTIQKTYELLAFTDWKVTVSAIDEDKKLKYFDSKSFELEFAGESSVYLELTSQLAILPTEQSTAQN